MWYDHCKPTEQRPAKLNVSTVLFSVDLMEEGVVVFSSGRLEVCCGRIRHFANL